eukprot:scaffold490_cov186-Amphora_coffeaeformis.AAC.5
MPYTIPYTPIYYHTTHCKNKVEDTISNAVEDPQTRGFASYKDSTLYHRYGMVGYDKKTFDNNNNNNKRV